MRARVIALSVVCLFISFSAYGQRIDEEKSSLVLGERAGEFSFEIENESKEQKTNLKLELLDKSGEVRAATEKDLRIKKGKKLYKVDMLFGGLLKTTDNEFLWYRLRYTLGDSIGIVSLSELVKDIFEVRVTSAKFVAAGQNFRVRVRAFDSKNELAARKVAIEGELELEIETDSGEEEEIVLKASGRTDKKGFAVLNFTVPDRVSIDEADLTITGRKNGIFAEVYDDLETPNWVGSVFMTIDKPLYQPGQKFNVRALYFDSNQNVLPETELEFKIKNEEDTLLYRETVKTSEFGIASISWDIPENAKLGNYKVEVDAESEISGNRQNFKVTRYDLPNFKVEAEPNKNFYLPADKKASITINADYLFGKPVTKGKVRVVQESGRKWNWRKQKYDVREDDSVEGVADENGKYVAEFDIGAEMRDLERSSWRKFRDLSFAAYFTDSTTNRTEQRRFDIRLSREPIHIYLTGKTYGSNSKLPVTFYVSTFYADGSPAICDVVLEGRADKKYYEDFEPIKRIKTNSLGAGKLEFRSPSYLEADQNLDIKINASDKKDRNGSLEEEISFSDGQAIKLVSSKAIYKPGEDVEVELFSSEKDALVYLDIVKGWSAIDSHFVLLKKGKGSIKIPYKEGFDGELVVSAYIEKVNSNGYLSLIRNTRGIIFPKQQNLKLDARFSDATYKPSEEATVNFSVLSGSGKPLESALGVVVFDKAIEESARTDADFGSYFSRFFGWLGYSKSFGGVSLKNLNDLDLSKPVSDDLQLAAEVMLSNAYYYPQIRRSEFDHQRPKYLFAKVIKRQFVPVEIALRKKYEKDFEFPNSELSLRKILDESGIRFGDLRDPWGEKYRVEYKINRQRIQVKCLTSGPDKEPKTQDDFIVADYGFNYFRKYGEILNETVKKHHEKTGKHIRTYQSLKTELSKKDINLDMLKDPWGQKYRVHFEIAGRSYVIRFESRGTNNNFQGNYYNRYKFDVWKTYTDYFAKTETMINRILSENVNLKRKPFPRSAEEFEQLIKAEGVPITSLREGYGRVPYAEYRAEKRYADKTVVKNGKTKIIPVTQEVAQIIVRSKGANGMNDSLASRKDDFDLARFSSVITEQHKGIFKAKTIVRYTVFAGAKGAIRGTVTDQTGAVVPAASVSVENSGKSFNRSESTNESGVFLIENIPSGSYTVKAVAPGFRTVTYSNIVVRSQNLTQMEIALELGNVTAEVTVSSDSQYTINASSASISTNMTVGGVGTGEGSGIGNGSGNGRAIGRVPEQKNSRVGQSSTPRLRKYFPETLVWNPEIITDKKGKASLKFKMADNITTWKLYTVASTKNGKIGIAEREVQSFQPFFVDLEPPKFLTQGDEIHLPSQVRNYTDSKQKVSVTMAKSGWFSFLPTKQITKISATAENTQKVEVASNGSENAVFAFRADKFIEKGKQRVTAIAKKESDAIEKPVTVRPNGEHVVKTESRLFHQESEFRIDFPSNAIAKTQKANLKIYPNLLAHVAESVEGLLQRPYGCGEQTISSTYPNLMILKFSSKENKLRKTAKKYLQKGYERLLGYQVSNGGFSYWGGSDSANIALTAYAIRFLTDAKSQIEVDTAVINRAESWLIKQQRADGSWGTKYRAETSENSNRTKMLTSYIARTLAVAKSKNKYALETALRYLKERNAEIDEPYALALFGLASLESGNTAGAKSIGEKLSEMAISEGKGVYWKLETNTPFYGWGKAGRIETTALVLQLLTKLKNQTPKTKELVSKGTQFLLKNKDRHGVWYSTQTTINVLDAFLATLAGGNSAKHSALRIAKIFVNGKQVKSYNLPGRSLLANPIDLDLSSFLTPKTNEIRVLVNDDLAVMSQVVKEHYVDWQDADISSRNINKSRQLKLDYNCDKQAVEVMQEVTCSVKTERIGFRGYGMLLAEIGIPPGAEVSRESLQNAMESDWSFSKYDILPDRIVVYMWARSGGTEFKFKFKPRYGIKAQTPASTVYDYYNDEARATVEPMKFEVK